MKKSLTTLNGKYLQGVRPIEIKRAQLKMRLASEFVAEYGSS
jgi:hypothetical protein